MRKYFPIYEEAVSHIWLCNCSTLNFSIYEKNLIFFFISAYTESTVCLPLKKYSSRDTVPVNSELTVKCVPVVPVEVELPGACHGAGHLIGREKTGRETSCQVAAHSTLHTCQGLFLQDLIYRCKTRFRFQDLIYRGGIRFQTLDLTFKTWFIWGKISFRLLTCTSRLDLLHQDLIYWG